jgi:hypothetical protein
MVIPVTLIASIGLDDLLQKVAARLQAKHFLPAVVLLVGLFSVNSYMLWDVLTNGTSWFDNNQANGVQFGADKLFTALKEELSVLPNSHAVISPEWAMIADLVARIYLGDDLELIEFGSIYDYARKIHSIKDNTIFAITPEEMAFAQNNPKFSIIKILRVIPYSKTKEGFYLIRLKYAPNAQALIDAENAERRRLVHGEIVIDGQPVQIGYTQNASPSVDAVFDDNPDTLYKTAEINPAVFDLTFPEEREFHAISILHGLAPIELKVTFFPAQNYDAKKYTAQFTGESDQGSTLELGQNIRALRVTIEVKVLNDDPLSIVHIWDINFK